MAIGVIGFALWLIFWKSFDGAIRIWWNGRGWDKKIKEQRKNQMMLEQTEEKELKENPKEMKQTWNHLETKADSLKH